MATTSQILDSAEQTLRTAEFGYTTLTTGKPQFRLIGLRNLVVFSRAVTNVLQKLRSKEEGFDEWYKPYQAEMEREPLLKYFYNLRSKILKEGDLRVVTGVHIKHLNTDSIRNFGQPPPNAKSFFIGDNIGGSGWDILMSDGSVEKFYVDLPPENVTVKFLLPDIPQVFKGKQLNDYRPETLARLYLDYLQNMVKDAKGRFEQK